MWAYYAIASLQIWQSLAMPQQPTLNIRLPGLSPQGGIDLCFLTGTCGRNQGAGPSVSPITYVDGISPPDFVFVTALLLATKFLCQMKDQI